MNRRRRGGRRGASLLELTFVILVVGILAAVAQPRYAAALARYRIDAAAERIAADLRYGSILARTTSRPVTVRFFSAGGASYRFDAVADPRQAGLVADPAEPSTWYFVDLTAEPYGVALSGSHVCTFDIHGMADRDQQITVGVGANTRTVSLRAGSDRVET